MVNLEDNGQPLIFEILTFELTDTIDNALENVYDFFQNFGMNTFDIKVDKVPWGVKLTPLMYWPDQNTS